MRSNEKAITITMTILSLVFALLSYIPDIFGAISLLISMMLFLFLGVVSAFSNMNLYGHKKIVICYVVVLIIIPIFRLSYYRFDSAKLLLYIIPFSIILCVLFHMGAKKKTDRKISLKKNEVTNSEIKKNKIIIASFRLFVSFLLVVYSWIWISDTNITLDFAKASEYKGIVTDRITTHNPYSLDFCYYHISYQDNKESRIISLPISYFKYNEYKEGDQITVVQKPGALGTQYYYIKH